MKLSNKFTLVRVILAPIVLVLYFLPIWMGLSPATSKFSAVSLIVTVVLLIFGELTDYWDGYYARKRNEVSDFGKLFDPFADVMLHLTTITCCMYSVNPVVHYNYPVILMLLFWREFSQSFLRMVAAKKGIAIGARKGGKFKTVMYISSGFYALACELVIRLNLDHRIPFFPVLVWISTGLFVVCVLCSYISFIDYLKTFGKTLKD